MTTEDQSQESQAVEIELAESPYLLYERNAGEFRIVDSISVSGDSMHLNFRSDELLYKGRDIIELSTRGLTLLVQTFEKSLVSNTMEALRDLTIVGGYDYFSYRKFNNGMAQCVGIDGSNLYYKVIPRLFRRIIDN